MGLLLTHFYSLFSSPEYVKILKVGLDAAGKTTMLYKLKLGKLEVEILPTVGYNIETVDYRNVKFIVWDVCGSGYSRQRLYLRHQFTSTVIIFVVDSNDVERVDEAREELHAILADDELRNAPLLVLANKCDLPYAMKTSELANKLRLPEIRDREWYIQSTCGATGEGVCEGLDWIVGELARRKHT